jgi:hypothetical protein
VQVLTVVGVYTLGYFVWLYTRAAHDPHAYKAIARTLSSPSWLIVHAYFASCFGPLVRVIVFAITSGALIVLISGVVSFGGDDDKHKKDDDAPQPMEVTSPAVVDTGERNFAEAINYSCRPSARRFTGQHVSAVSCVRVHHAARHTSRLDAVASPATNYLCTD